MKFKTLLILVVAAILAVTIVAPVSAYDVWGYHDDFGFHIRAHSFNGIADGLDYNIDGMVFGDDLFANEHLVMKFPNTWWGDRVDARGKLSNGINVIWVGPELENSPYWVEGGSPLWGSYEYFPIGQNTH